MSSKVRLAVVGALCAALLTFCGDPVQPPPAGKDAGPAAKPDAATSLKCLTGEDCAAGECIDLRCQFCEDIGCAPGLVCQPDGKCRATCDAGGCSPQSGPDAGPACQTRLECADGLACRAGHCGEQDPAGACASTDECSAGFFCKESLCVSGCATNADCAGTTAGPRCDPATNRCGPCVANFDCPAGQRCNPTGACEQAAACIDRSTCGNQACVDSFCAPCTTGTQCGAGFNCNGGKCEKSSGCTDDTACTAISPGHWCDKSTGNCEWGCLAGPAANCDQNCCGPAENCNTTTHQCEKGQCNNCNGACTFPQTCNTTTCTCSGGSSDGGLPIGGDGGLPIGTKCDSSCACPGGGKCTGVTFPPLCSSLGYCL